ncbi:LexA family transcriptional regulator [Vibrio vulnificus]|uniref:LexA family transcriptional regulator n=1 Tax=Vibrio vulnificus TaxID=672 RepID=UPI003242EF87
MDKSKIPENKVDNTLINNELVFFSDRLKETIGDMSIRSFAKKCGLSEGVMRNYIAGKTFPSLDKLVLIAKVGNKELNWLCSGTSCNVPKDSLSAASSDFIEEFALIPGYRIQACSGNGDVNPDPLEPTKNLAVKHNWLISKGFNKHDLAIISAKGDSMEPTISNNDTLVVHMGRNKPLDGNIYIFRNGDNLFVRRYQDALSCWRLISDNPIYDNLDLPKEEQHPFEVVGQVVQITKDIGD